jgi:hypothetical protein
VRLKARHAPALRPAANICTRFPITTRIMSIGTRPTQSGCPVRRPLLDFTFHPVVVAPVHHMYHD